MANALDQIAGQASSIQRAVQWACDLEATSPKAGNVHPDRSFHDLTHCDFMTASTIAADCFADQTQSVTARALKAARLTCDSVGSNVNLGILLLLTPLVACDEKHAIQSVGDWNGFVGDWLSELTAKDSKNLFDCIRAVAAGGLGTVEEMDVNDPDQTTDIVAAMHLACDRDRIALQWSNNFRDLIENVVPIMKQSLAAAANLLSGISNAHLRLLADAPDSLIARKCGQAVADDVQKRAANVDLLDDASRQAFDDFLRSDGNQLNPGTTADLIAASLYILMRTPK